MFYITQMNAADINVYALIVQTLHLVKFSVRAFFCVCVCSAHIHSIVQFLQMFSLYEAIIGALQ
jgi:hypothetical protein